MSKPTEILRSLTEVSTYLDMSVQLESAINSMTQTVQTSVINYLLSLFVFIALFKAVYNFWKRELKPGVDYPEIVRVVVLILFLLGYRSIMSQVDAVANRFIASFDHQVDADLDTFYKISTVGKAAEMHGFSEEQSKELYKKLSGNSIRDKGVIADFVTENTTGVISEGGITEIFGFFKDLKNTVSNLFQTVLIGSSYYLLSEIKSVLLKLILGINVLLYIGGPLAVCADLIFKGRANSWFAIWLTTKASFFVFMMIEGFLLHLMTINLSSFAAGATSNITETYHHILPGFLISSIIMYALVFTISGWFIGSGKAGSVLSAGAGLAMMGVNSALVGGSKMAGMPFKGKPDK